MDESATMHTGLLGSAIRVLRADAGAIAEPAAIDRNRRLRRICLDPVRGVITLMASSRLHCEAVEGVRFSRILAERMETVARIVRRRQRSGARVSEEASAYSAG